MIAMLMMNLLLAIVAAVRTLVLSVVLVHLNVSYSICYYTIKLDRQGFGVCGVFYEAEHIKHCFMIYFIWFPVGLQYGTHHSCVLC